MTRMEKVTATGDVVIIEVKRGDFRDGGGNKDGRDVRVEETVKMLEEDYTLVAFTSRRSLSLRCTLGLEPRRQRRSPRPRTAGTG